MNKAAFMERLGFFDISQEATKKYYQIFEQMQAAQDLGVVEAKKRAENLLFIGYLHRGNQMVQEDSLIDEMQKAKTAKFAAIPYPLFNNLLGLKTVRNFYPVENLHPYASVKVYMTPSQYDTPYLSLAIIASQLPAEHLKRAKGVALRLKDNFAETGYLHIAKAYEYQVELWE